MSITIAGVVKNGVIIPNSPLPEGAHVEIHLGDESTDMPQELQDDLLAWQHASADALELVERLAKESDTDEKR